MDLMPDDIRARLLANGGSETETDHIPVVKFFDPTGAATWIITEMMPDGDTMFGLCDLGSGHPRLGHFSLVELVNVPASFGFSIERDLNFRPRFTLSAYAEAARLLGFITEVEHLLAGTARRLKLPDNPELPPDFRAVNPRM